MQARRILSGRFASLSDFLDRTVEEDREFLPEWALDRFPAVCCGMSNGAGGWIVLGAEWDEDVPVVHGVSDPSGLERRLRAVLAGERTLSADSVSSFRVVEAEGVPLLIIRVEPAEWWRRPVCVGGNYIRGVYRRIEGVDVVSGKRVCFRLALDALERLRDESAVPGMTASDLHEESAASFREAVIERRPEWRGLSPEGFWARTLVLSDGALTRAGWLLLGKNSARVRAAFNEGTEDEELFEVRNLWRAWLNLLPRFCSGLSGPCAAALRECFVNALVHAEHDAGNVMVTGSGGRVRIENPGLSRSRRGESLCRNERLMRMFRLAGAASGEGRGLDLVRFYRSGFELRHDFLELMTIAELDLEHAVPLPEPSPGPAEMPLPVVSVDAPNAEWDQTALERFGGGPAEEEEEKSPASAESVPAVISVSDFLVVLPERRDGLEKKEGLEEKDEKSEPAIEEPSMDAASYPVEASGGSVLALLGEEPGTEPAIGEPVDEPESTEPMAAAPVPPEPEAPEAAAPAGNARPGSGKKFAFGNAAEELELAVARMRRGEPRPSPDEAPRDRAES
ncbi:hypothetical protein [uncultured Fretibacterium sp.]|uniref:AlbA family DNA-binding domain-containing protein n=1 Tax=uncultured Fretibacterium sp. TaxID=1678694 RepID=UPI00262207E0|nr:hypothetical protein [uncultured Fretibacterium sp.]